MTIVASGVHARLVARIVPARWQRRRVAGSVALFLGAIAFGSSIADPSGAAAQEYGRYSIDDDANPQLSLAPSPSLYWLLNSACPDSRVQTHELDAVRTIEGKLSFAAAMRAAARTSDEVRYGRADKDGTYHFANTPREVAVAVRQNLGPSSVVTQGVGALAFVVDTAEAGAQIPLDQLNVITKMIAVEGRRIGLRRIPVFRFRSRIENDRAGVTLSARW